MADLDLTQFMPKEKSKGERITQNIALPILAAIEQIATSYNTKGQFVGTSVQQQMKGMAEQDEVRERGRNEAVDRALKLRQIQTGEDERKAKTEAETKRLAREQRMRENAVYLQTLPESERPAAAQKLLAELDPEDYAKKLAFPKEEADKPLTQQDIFTQENQLRNQYEGQTKDFRIIRDAYTRIGASAKDPSAAGDLALIFSYMKILDPGSTVREGEFANAQNAGGIPTRIISMYNNALSGQRLAPEQRSDFVNRAQRLYQGAEDQYKKTKETYRNLASSYKGLNPDRVALDYLAQQLTRNSQAGTGQNLVWRKAADGKEYEYDAITKQPTGRSR